MKRREFLQQSLALSAISLSYPLYFSSGCHAAPPGRGPYAIKFAPHFGMFRAFGGKDPIDQLKFMAEQGFTAFEDNTLSSRPSALQEKIGAELQRLKMEMGIFVATADFKNPTFVSNDKSARENILSDIRKSIEVAKRVNAKWLTVVLGTFDPKQPLDYQTANAIENLKYCAELCEKSGHIMVMEPLNHWVNHPGLFLHKIPQAYLIAKSVGSPSCKILFDVYHQQITEGNLIANIDRAWDEIAYFQIADTPGRKEPGTGEINYVSVLKHLIKKGYTGVVGMEHGNSIDGREGEKAVIAAYTRLEQQVLAA